MAYNKRNKLERIKQVQDTARKHLLPGVSMIHVFNTYIHPQFKISRGVFFRYMNVPVKEELDKLNNNDNNGETKFKQLEMELFK